MKYEIEKKLLLGFKEMLLQISEGKIDIDDAILMINRKSEQLEYEEDALDFKKE